MKTIIVDIDGTLAKIEHRVQLAIERKWDEFSSLCHLDGLHEDVAQLIKLFSDADYAIIGMTGRRASMGIATWDWLADHGLAQYFDDIVFRTESDYRSDVTLKLGMMVDYFGSIEEALKSVQFILEDRQGVVDAYREAGFNCWQVRRGTY